MGIFSEIKKLLWVKKAVAESAADKAVDKGREISHDLSEKAADTWHRGKEKAEEIGEKIVTKAKEGFEEVKEKAADLWDKKDDWTQDKPIKETSEDAASLTTSSNARKAGEKMGDPQCSRGHSRNLRRLRRGRQGQG